MPPSPCPGAGAGNAIPRPVVPMSSPHRAQQAAHQALSHPSGIAGIDHAGSGCQCSRSPANGQPPSSNAAITRSPSARMATASPGEIRPRRWTSASSSSSLRRILHHRHRFHPGELISPAKAQNDLVTASPHDLPPVQLVHDQQPHWGMVGARGGRDTACRVRGTPCRVPALGLPIVPPRRDSNRT